MNKLLCIGEMLIDFLPGQEAGSYVKRAGGAPANVAVAAARQGLDVSMTCMVGDDDFGRFLYQTLKDNGVAPTNQVMTKAATTTMAFVSLDAHGDRSFTFARKPGADMFLSCDDVDRAYIPGKDVVHAGSCSLSGGPAAEATIYALKKAKEAGKLVTFDVNYRNLMWDDDEEAAAAAVEKVLPYIDILKISDEEIGMIGGEEMIPAVMEKNGITLVVETLGGSGARYYLGKESAWIPAIPSEVVDTCGAGDAFFGSLIASLVKNGVQKAEDITKTLAEEAVKHGHVAGSLCVREKGAMESLPDAAACEKFYCEYYGN